jgi:hypothetical protein
MKRIRTTRLRCDAERQAVRAPGASFQIAGRRYDHGGVGGDRAVEYVSAGCVRAALETAGCPWLSVRPFRARSCPTFAFLMGVIVLGGLGLGRR